MSLRHTCFTRLREAGMALRPSSQAGHRSIASTRIYLHLSIDWLAEEYARPWRPFRHRRRWPDECPPKSAQTPSPWWSTLEFPWDETPATPVMVATMASYLGQLGVSARPSTVGAAEQALRHFAGQVTQADPTCISMAGVDAATSRPTSSGWSPRPGKTGKPLSAVTIRNRLERSARSSSGCATGTTTTPRAGR